MVPEWKVIQHLYHITTDVHDDDMSETPFEFVVCDDILIHAKQYFEDREKPYVYPSKSFIVAIVYADYISTRWPDQDFYKLLEDPELLYGNDDFYVVYSKEKEIYDELIEIYKQDKNAGMLPDIRQWAKKEFMEI